MTTTWTAPASATSEGPFAPVLRLEVGRIRLRPASDDDTGLLYGIASESPAEWPRVCDRVSPNPVNFMDLLWSDVSALYIAEVDRGLAVGCIGIHRANFRNATAWLDAVAVPVPGMTEPLWAATILAAGHAFDTWNLRKLYTIDPDWRPRTFGGAGSVATEEGRLRDHYLADGCRWDAVISAVSREPFIEARGRLVDDIATTFGTVEP